jgi:phosphoribosylformylglycinamidine synthase PurS subunit
VKIRVAITRKGGLSDPEGVEVHRALGDLGYAAVSEVHFGRTITITMDGDDAVAAVAGVEEMCKRLLTNPVIEDYVVEVVE